MEPTYKVITLGSYGVGKTCILLKATEENFSFPQTYICTIGVDFKSKMHQYDGQISKLIIWDTAGQERFHHINRLYYNGCQAVILVYDVTNVDSFEKISLFYEDFCRNSDKNAEKNVCFVLVGNKKDSELRKVPYAQGEAFAKKLNMQFVECSALTGENIEEIFDVLLGEIRWKEVEPKDDKNLCIVKTVEKKKKCCE